MPINNHTKQKRRNIKLNWNDPKMYLKKVFFCPEPSLMFDDIKLLEQFCQKIIFNEVQRGYKIKLKS